MDQELQRFVRDALSRGQSRAAIHDHLLAAGWRESEVETALESWVESDFPVPVPRRRPYLPARVTFLHLILFAALYTAALNIGGVLFVMIERRLPDAARPGDGNLTNLRGALAALVIALPLFLWMNRLIVRNFAREPEQRGSAVRKWLTYLTLFLATLVLVGNLIALVMGFLSGELTRRFLLKVAVVAGIAGVVFWHYLRDLQTEERKGRDEAPRPSWIARIGVALAFVVVIAGFVVSGTPPRARQRALDSKRSEDLMTLNAAIDTYWGEHGALPDSLGALNQSGAGWLYPVRDVARGEPYDYRITGPTTYELCATFDAPAEATRERTPPRGAESRFSVHAAGRVCFPMRVQERTKGEAGPRP